MQIFSAFMFFKAEGLPIEEIVKRVQLIFMLNIDCIRAEVLSEIGKKGDVQIALTTPAEKIDRVRKELSDLYAELSDLYAELLSQTTKLRGMSTDTRTLLSNLQESCVKGTFVNYLCLETNIASDKIMQVANEMSDIPIGIDILTDHQRGTATQIGFILRKEDSKKGEEMIRSLYLKIRESENVSCLEEASLGYEYHLLDVKN